jgi:hypothetical protein
MTVVAPLPEGFLVQLRKLAGEYSLAVLRELPDIPAEYVPSN